MKIFKDDFNIFLQIMNSEKKIQDIDDNLSEVVEEIYKCTKFNDEKAKEEYYILKYPQLSNTFPIIIKKACETNFDYEKFKWMMEIQKRVKENKISQHNASVEVGERLVDDHVKPKLG
tara:strand:+ start:121 stop:474 length:354 start_codon:yes stop_codon:yes gene_type:complete